MPDTTLYRLLTRPAADAAAAAGRLDPVPGLDVGFIHLSTLPQARGTAAAYFSSCGDLCMLPISASALAAAGLELRYEEAAPPAGAAQRAGEFPHVFGGSIPWSCLAAPPIDLPLVDGKHAFPGDGMNRTLTGPDQQHSRNHLEKLLPSIGQICRSPFVVRVLDQPPSGAAGGDVKLVHWIRHGQGFHNLLSDLYKEHGIQGKPYLRPELHDPPLTAVGREQAVALRSTTQSLSPSLVVVSPLARATKTALLAFDHLVGRVPFLAHESCREISGVNACDGRRSVTEARRDGPRDCPRCAPRRRGATRWSLEVVRVVARACQCGER